MDEVSFLLDEVRESEETYRMEFLLDLAVDDDRALYLHSEVHYALMGCTR